MLESPNPWLEVSVLNVNAYRRSGPTEAPMPNEIAPNLGGYARGVFDRLPLMGSDS